MPTPTPTAPTRADWLAARAMLASRRLRPWLPLGALLLVAAFGAVLFVRAPWASRTAATQRTAARVRAAQLDTVALVASARAARQRLATSDSALQGAQRALASQAASAELPAALVHTRDSLRALVASLDGQLERASKAPLPASYRALGATRALREQAAVRAVLDSLDALDRVRQTLDPAAAGQREFAQITERTNAIGNSLQLLGKARRAALMREIDAIALRSAGAAAEDSPVPDTATLRAARDSAQRDVTVADSSLRATRLQQALIVQHADSLAQERATRILGASPAVAGVALVVVAIVFVFTIAVTLEVRTPTIANAREVERVTGIPVFATVTRASLSADGRARLQGGSGVDPVRMVYLALTAGAARDRLVCIAGDRTELVAAVAGRLSVSAATDERATLVVDLSPGTPAASRYFAERSEPGFTEAIAGVRLWREVARPVGASEGLAIDVIPAGARRDDTPSSVANATNRSEFALFADDYDFAVLVAPSAASTAIATQLTDAPVVLYVARIAQTRLADLQRSLAALESEATKASGIILIETRSARRKESSTA